jgi:glycosyltransferase involved in cell wall biosynthesis
MKVLFLIHSLSSGGAERFTTTLANSLYKKGIEVSILTLESKVVDFYEVEPRIKRISLKSQNNIAEKILRIFNPIKKIYEIRKELKKESPDVAIGIMTASNCYLAISALGLNVKILGSERVHPPMFPLSKPWEFVRRISYKHISLLIAQTETTAVWLRKNAPAHETKVIPNPVIFPLPRNEPTIKPNNIIPEIGTENKIVLGVGRLVHQKGFDRLIDAFHLITKDHPEWYLVIIGEGALRPQLENKIKTLSLERNVFLPGRVGNLEDWYKTADIYVLPSRYEGFPNTLIEAMSYGLPSIATNCETGPSDIIDHEKNGILISNSNMNNLPEKIETLLLSNEKRKKIGLEASKISETLSLERITSQWADLILNNKQER